MTKKKHLVGVPKIRKFIIKFRSMQEILLTESHWFDKYGNLHVSGDGWDREVLAPINFKMLGTMKEFKSTDNLRFPRWTIDSEYEDIFAPNQALRRIATGMFDKEECEEIAKEAVVIPPYSEQQAKSEG